MEPQPAPQKGISKPFGGFVVVLTVALIVGGWLYVDMVKNELESKVDAVSADLQAVRAARKAAAEKETAPPAEPKTVTYAAGLGDYRFQVDLPEGFRLSVGAKADEALVIMGPTPENEAPIPDMVISLLPVRSERYLALADAKDPGNVFVRTPDGTYVFWLRGWEDLAWPEFEKVAASFKAL